MEKHDDRQTVLIIDDSSSVIMLISSLLKDLYRTRIATSGERGVVMAATAPAPDLILLDVVMPGIDGYEACRRLKADPALADIPVMFLTGTQDKEGEEQGLSVGAVDYIAKPINPPVLMVRIATQLSLRQAQLRLQRHNHDLEAEVRRRTEEIHRLQQVTILALATLAETRDNETGNHLQRTQHYVAILARQLRESPRFRELRSDEYLDLLVRSVPLHDIGKVGVPDNILLKPGRLTPAEFEIMKQHTRIGHDALLNAERSLGITDSYLYIAREVAVAHHERWDGAGYPEGLSGDDIPLAARLMAIADVYDACISVRVYKPAMPHPEVVDLIERDAGIHFDPEVVDAFIAVKTEFMEVAQRYSDAGKEAA